MTLLTRLTEHDIDLGDTQPVRQQFYRVNPEKRKHLDAEVKYMLDHGITEPSSSSDASLCLMVPTSDKTPAPMFTILAVGQPFEHLIIDYVGPLSSGAVYFLTKYLLSGCISAQ